MAVALSDSTKLPYLLAWCARNQYSPPVYSSQLGAVEVAGVDDADVSAFLAGVTSTTVLGQKIYGLYADKLPGGLSTTLADAKTQATRFAYSLQDAAASHLLIDILPDSTLWLRLPIYREIAAGGGNAYEILAIDEEISAYGSAADRITYAQARLASVQAYSQYILAASGRVRKAIDAIDAETTVADIHTELDDLLDWLEANTGIVTVAYSGSTA
jgi:hypothetical protein